MACGGYTPRGRFRGWRWGWTLCDWPVVVTLRMWKLGADATPGTDHSDEVENWGRAVRREVRAASSTPVIMELGWDGGSNGGIDVISWVLYHHRRDGLWKKKGMVGRHSGVASSDDEVVAFSEG